MNNQFDLLKSSKFAPLFITQFLGALNNNIYKNAIIILITFSALQNISLSTSVMVNICAGLFILPFFFFSAFAGELADLKEKSGLVQKLKLVEIFTVILGASGVYLNNIYLMWISLFCMGIQAAFFGPLKYSILPQHLKQNELMGGNGLIESGTFIAILIGTIFGGWAITTNFGKEIVSLTIFIISLLGYYFSTKIPQAPSFHQTPQKINFFKSFKNTIYAGMEIKSVFLATIAISWFWFLGATLLSQFPLIVKDVIGANPNMVTILLAVFAIGIALGSIFCEKLSGHKVEHGLVPFGAFGVTIFLYLFAHNLGNISYDVNNNFFDPKSSLTDWLNYTNFYYLIFSLLGISIFSGFYTVPLYAFIQYRSSEKNRSKIIGSNNIFNSLFMVGSALFAITLNYFGFSLIEMIYVLTVLNLLVAIYIFTVVPEFMARFIIWILIKTVYRIDSKNLHIIPQDGPGLIISNHVSFLDALFIFGLSPRPVKFVMYYKIYNLPILNYLFKAVGAIPISSKKENNIIYDQAFEKIDEYLKDGELVVIFPEGSITHDGNMSEFKPGILKILEKNKVNIYPCALSGLWGSMYSRKDKSIFRFIPKAFFNHRVKFNVGELINEKDINLINLQKIVLELRGDIL